MKGPQLKTLKMMFFPIRFVEPAFPLIPSAVTLLVEILQSL